MNIPEKIYKYQPATVQSLINLKSQYIYFNSSKKFNDPFDGNIKLKFEDINEKDIDILKKSFLKDLIDEIYHPEVINFSFIEFSEALKEMGYKIIEDRTQNLYRHKGISCFSERKDSQLMWSHYASSGKGFCLEFDTKKEPFQKLLPVKYEDKPPLLDFMKIVSLEKNYLLRKLLCLKSSDWAYEKEWRCFHNEINKAYVYEPNALTGVYFGSEIEIEFLEIICLILQGQNSNVKFYQGLKSEDSFNIDFKDFNYIPYILTK